MPTSTSRTMSPTRKKTSSQSGSGTELRMSNHLTRWSFPNPSSHSTKMPTVSTLPMSKKKPPTLLTSVFLSTASRKLPKSSSSCSLKRIKLKSKRNSNRLWKKPLVCLRVMRQQNSRRCQLLLSSKSSP